jgi:hypothetical protein
MSGERNDVILLLSDRLYRSIPLVATSGDESSGTPNFSDEIIGSFRVRGRVVQLIGARLDNVQVGKIGELLNQF